MTVTVKVLETAISDTMRMLYGTPDSRGRKQFVLTALDCSGIVQHLLCPKKELSNEPAILYILIGNIRTS